MYPILLPPPLDPSIKMEVSPRGRSARARQITHYQEPYYPVAKHPQNWKFPNIKIYFWKFDKYLIIKNHTIQLATSSEFEFHGYQNIFWNWIDIFVENLTNNSLSRNLFGNALDIKIGYKKGNICDRHMYLWSETILLRWSMFWNEIWVLDAKIVLGDVFKTY